MQEIRSELYKDLAHDLGTVYVQKQFEAHMEAEAARFHDTCELITAVGIPEAEALVLMTLWQEGVDLSPNRLDTALRKRADEPRWLPDKKTLFGYCTNSLKPIGLVIQDVSSARRGMHTTHKFNEKHGMIGVEIAGLLSDWGLQYPDTSTQQLGAKASSSDTRAPESRLNVLLELLTNPDQGHVAVSEIKGLSNIARYVSAPALDQGLLASGWVKTERVLQDNDRLYRLNENLRPRMYDKLKPEIKILYEFVSTLHPGDTFTHQQALDYITGQLSQVDPTADLAEARSTLSDYLGKRYKNGFAAIERLDNYNHGRTRTRLEIDEKYREALSDLVNIVIGIHDRDPALLAYGRKRAAEIISNPQDVDKLLNKSYDFSPHARRVSRANTKATIMDILAASTRPLTIEEVRLAYNNHAVKPPSNEGTTKNLSYTTISRYLLQLGEEGVLIAEEDRVNPTLKTKQSRFSIPPSKPIDS